MKNFEKLEIFELENEKLKAGSYIFRSRFIS
ncbi:MAG: hypothetical protein K0R36_3137 [Chryseobacterium sp.]|nr:hypothetical protein [Chryseobacterium sp.]